MSLYQTGPPRPAVLTKAMLAAAPVLATGFAFAKAGNLAHFGLPYAAMRLLKLPSRLRSPLSLLS
jgi:hypothetical protein